MRSQVLVLVTTLVPACSQLGFQRNGLDGNLQFDPDSYGTIAAGTTVHVEVARYAGGGYDCHIDDGCEGGPVTPIVIDSATCGDQCSAKINAESDGQPIVDVLGSATASTQLVVSAHAIDGSEVWTDRFPLEFVTPRAFALLATDEPLGATFATEVGAQVELSACPLAASVEQINSGCLGGTFTPTLTGDGAASVTPTDTTDPFVGSLPVFTVTLATAGTGTVGVAALGITRTETFRAAAPSEWREISFAAYDPACCDLIEWFDVAATQFIHPAGPQLSIPHAGIASQLPLAATATLADGTQALLSASRVQCAPSTVVSYTGPSGTGLWAGSLFVSGPGDATCTVAGYESLGVLTVHVE